MMGDDGGLPCCERQISGVDAVSSQPHHPY